VFFDPMRDINALLLAGVRLSTIPINAAEWQKLTG